MSHASPIDQPRFDQLGNLDPTSTAAIETWYRNLRPDTNINDVSLPTHLEALSSYMLLVSDQPLPENQLERNQAGLALTTTNRSALINRVAAQGVDGLIVPDLILELSEREDQLPDRVKVGLLDFAIGVASSARANPLLSPNDKIAANNRLVNLELEKLRFDRQHRTGGVPNFADEYITIVRKEAKWLAEHTAGVKSGTLFESFIGCFAKYQAWYLELEDDLSARHATLREDQPSRARDGGSGHEYAHDVHISNYTNDDVDPAMVQVKWGPGCDELESRYDRSRVTFVAETTEDGHMGSNHDIANALRAIAGKSISDQETCDELAQRYSNAISSIKRTAAARASGRVVLTVVS